MADQVDVLEQAARLTRVLSRALQPDIREQLVEEMLRVADPKLGLLEFADWFRNKYMTWLPNVPICTACGTVMTESVHILKYEVAFTPNPKSWIGHDIVEGPETFCQKVERYVCPKCHEVRYAGRENDVLVLMRIRTGRCGEIAIFFTSVLLALGYKARLMFTQGDDHLFTEVYNAGEWLPIDIAAPDVRRLINDRGLYRRWGWKLVDLYAIEPGKLPVLVDTY